MKSANLAVALAFAVSISAAGLATAKEDQRIIIGDNVPVWLVSDITVEDIECFLKRGTKVMVIERVGSIGFLVEVVDGRKRGCSRFVSADYIETAPENFQTGITTGRWENEVPVFNSRGSFYSAISSMDRDGHYNRQTDNVACKVKIGTDVEFKPYLDWGVGEVRVGNCSGWIDRKVIQ